jgi:hypothetical protein
MTNVLRNLGMYLHRRKGHTITHTEHGPLFGHKIGDLWRCSCGSVWAS